MRKRQPPLRQIYDRLFETWGPQHWWPGETRLEICVGAILTQNTAWSNVERAIARLKEAKALNLRAIHEASPERLADWIRPAGYFNVKARRLQAWTGWVMRTFGGRLARVFREPTDALRERLLDVNGIGRETADSMLLYAGGHPVFVIDAYTRRFMARHGWADPDMDYDTLAAVFTRALPRDPALYNEFHALIVRLGKTCCRPTNPRCAECPLQRFPFADQKRSRWLPVRSSRNASSVSL